MSKKIIAVVGATGAQAGGLVRAILNDPEGGFAARTVTRNPGSDAAKALAAAGAEVVQADLDDVSSLEKAFAGAYGAYCLTNFWEHFSPQKETQHGKNLADAARAAGLQHVVWSTFEDSRDSVPLDDDRMPTLQEHYKVPHFDAKADANQYFEGLPTTYFLTSGYYDNFIGFGWGPQRGEDGSLFVAYPMDDKKLPLIWAEDIGKCAYGVFKAGDEFIGQTVGVAAGHYTGDEIAAALSEAFGTPISYQAVPADVYRSFDFPGADDVGNMFQFKRDFQEVFLGNRDLDRSHRLNPEMKSFEEWLVEFKDRIPMPE